MLRCPYPDCGIMEIEEFKKKPDKIIGFCPSCEEGVIRCPHSGCGALNRILAHFCKKCGREINWFHIHGRFKKKFRIKTVFQPLNEHIFRADVSNCLLHLGETRSIPVQFEQIHGFFILQVNNGHYFIIKPFKGSSDEALAHQGSVAPVEVGQEEHFIHKPLYYKHNVYMTSERQIYGLSMLNTSEKRPPVYKTESCDEKIFQNPLIIQDKMFFAEGNEEEIRLKFLNMEAPGEITVHDDCFQDFVSQIIPAWKNELFFFDSKNIFRYALNGNQLKKKVSVPNPCLSNRKPRFRIPAFPQADDNYVYLCGYNDNENRTLYAIDRRLNIREIPNTSSGKIQFTLVTKPTRLYVANDDGIFCLNNSGRILFQERAGFCAEFAPLIYGHYIIFNQLVSQTQHSEKLMIYDRNLNPVMQKQVEDLIAKPIIFTDRLALMKKEKIKQNEKCFLYMHKFEVI